jgi:hypothetical protein
VGFHRGFGIWGEVVRRQDALRAHYDVEMVDIIVDHLGRSVSTGVAARQIDRSMR